MDGRLKAKGGLRVRVMRAFSTSPVLRGFIYGKKTLKNMGVIF